MRNPKYIKCSGETYHVETGALVNIINLELDYNVNKGHHPEINIEVN